MNKFMKTITIMAILLTTIFTAGCESQEEKFTKLENKAKATIMEVSVNTVDGKYKSEKEGIANMINKVEPIIMEMENVAKGNKELEMRVKHEKETIKKLKEIYEIK